MHWKSHCDIYVSENGWKPRVKADLRWSERLQPIQWSILKFVILFESYILSGKYCKIIVPYSSSKSTWEKIWNFNDRACSQLRSLHQSGTITKIPPSKFKKQGQNHKNSEGRFPKVLHFSLPREIFLCFVLHTYGSSAGTGQNRDLLPAELWLISRWN